MEWLPRLLQALQDPANYIDALTLGAIYALIAVGYTMVYGIIKLINFAHGEVIMLGAYFALLCVTQIQTPLLLAIFLAMGGCALAGAMIDWSAYLPQRRSLPLPEWLSLAGLLLFAGLAIARFTMIGSGGGRWLSFALAGVVLLLTAGAMADLAGCFGPARYSRNGSRLTALISAIGMSLSLQTIAQLLWTANYRSFPESAIPAFFNETLLTIGGKPLLQGKELVTWLATGLLMTVLLLIVHRSRLGKAMRACALDQQTAALMGINVNHVIAATFMIGSAMAAVAGVLYSLKVGGNISPRMGYYPGVIAFAAAVLGGIGSIPGAVLGGLIIGFTEVFAGNIRSEYDKAFAFGLMVVFILFRPRGLLGRKEAKRA